MPVVRWLSISAGPGWRGHDDVVTQVTCGRGGHVDAGREMVLALLERVAEALALMSVSSRMFRW